jgi:hypothetical protein
MLDAYASAIVNTARDEPDGLGCIAEEDVKLGRFRISQDERISNQNQEELLLIATIKDLLYHEVALHEQADDGSHLVFPSQFTREISDLSEPEDKAVIFLFEGPVLNIYATLAVRLAHSGVFHKQEMWKNAVTYTARVGGTCGMVLHEIEEGRGKLTLFFKPDASEETRFQFEEYVWNHLRRRSLEKFLKRQRIFVCPNAECGEAITEGQVAKRRQFGHDTIKCPVCETLIELLDREERLATSRSQITHEMDKAADDRRDDEVEVFRRKGQQAVEQHEKDRSKLRQQMAVAFSESELRTLCFDLRIEFEELTGKNKSDKICELIAYCERRGKLCLLVAMVKQQRPNIDLE